MEKAALGKTLAVIGALLALLSGLYSVFADKPLIAVLTNDAILGGLGGSQLDIMGVIGIFGGILALAPGISWLMARRGDRRDPRTHSTVRPGNPSRHRGHTNEEVTKR